MFEHLIDNATVIENNLETCLLTETEPCFEITTYPKPVAGYLNVNQSRHFCFLYYIHYFIFFFFCFSFLVFSWPNPVWPMIWTRWREKRSRFAYVPCLRFGSAMFCVGWRCFCCRSLLLQLLMSGFSPFSFFFLSFFCPLRWCYLCPRVG